MLQQTFAWAGVFAALAVGVLASVCSPFSDAACIAAALASRPAVPPPTTRAFVHRAAIDAIAAAATSARSFVVVEGGIRVGKSVAVRAAAARLSAQRTVLWAACTSRSTADTVLQRLYGLRRNPLVDYLSGLLRVPAGHPAQTEELVLSSRGGGAAAGSAPEPVLVVERAELLAPGELARLLLFASDLRYAGLGRFVFVLSPSDEPDSLAAVRGTRGLSSAKVVTVQDLSRNETLEFLGQRACAPERAAAVHGLLGGHLPHLLDEAVPLFCAGALDAGGLAEAFTAEVRGRLNAVEGQMGCRGCACQAACTVLSGDWGSSLLAAARQQLLVQRLTRAPLRSWVHVIDAPFVRSYLQLHCNCSIAETTVPAV